MGTPFPCPFPPRLMAPSPSLNQTAAVQPVLPQSHLLSGHFGGSRSQGSPQTGPAGPCSGPHTLGLLRGWLPTAGVSSAGPLDKDLSFLPAPTRVQRPPGWGPTSCTQTPVCPSAPSPAGRGSVGGGGISGGGHGGRRAAPLASTHLLTRGDVLAPFPSSQEPPELEANVSNSAPLPSRHSPPRRP